MIPYLLALAGGYLIGSANKDREVFADGGVMSNLQEQEEQEEHHGLWFHGGTGIDRGGNFLYVIRCFIKNFSY